ncbi:MAG TPA: hypothetical protein VF071_13320 [Candidatus Limnocylindria bacterium]
MTALAPTIRLAPRSRPVAPGVVGAAAVAGALLMALAAISLASLAVAFPIVLSLVERGAISLASADLSASRSLAGLGWAFLLGGGAHLLAAIGLLDSNRWLQRAAIAVSGVGLAIATIAVTAVGPGMAFLAALYAGALFAAILRRATA